MTDLRSLEQTLSDNLPWNKARIKFVARFLLALFSQRTVNLARLGACQKFSVNGQSQLFFVTKGNNTYVRSKTENRPLV